MYKYGINSITQIRSKPNSSKIAHFPNIITSFLQLDQKNHFLLLFQIFYFFTKCRTTLTFSDPSLITNQTSVRQKYKYLQIMLLHSLEDMLAILKFQLRKKYYPELYQVNDNNFLVLNVAHTCHPEITKLIP